MALQTNDEMIRVADEWFRLFCPPNLVKDGTSGKKNAELIMERCLQKYSGILTISGMTEAVHELGAAHLDLISEPKQLTQEEKAALFQKREFERIQREQLENAVPFQDRMAAAEKAKREAELETQRQATAWKKRNSLISDFSVSAGPSRIDEACTQYFRNQLLQVLAKKNGQPDWVVTLAKVEEALRNMNDDEKLRRQFAALVRAQANAKVEKQGRGQ